MNRDSPPSIRPSWRTEVPQWIIIAAMFALAAWSWPRLPEQIPVHWNLDSQVDGYGDKFVGLLLTPVVAVGLYLMNLPWYFINPGEQNRATLLILLGAFRIFILFVIAAIYFLSVAAVFGHHVNWIADMISVGCFGMAALFAITGNFMGKLRPNWFVGVRTPWTLASKYSWNQTHRLAGWMSMLMALAMAGAGIMRSVWGFFAAFAFCLCCVGWVVIYSYQAYRRDPDRNSATNAAPGAE